MSSRTRRSTLLPAALVRQSYLTAFLTLLLIYTRYSFHLASTSSSSSLPSRLLLPHSRVPLHLFAAPKPFIGTDKLIQTRALKSWLALKPTPRITYLGDVQGLDDVVRKYRVQVIKNVDLNVLGVPLLNSMLKTILEESDVGVTVLLNADIVLFDDFMYALTKIQLDFPKAWLAIAARWDLETVPQQAYKSKNELLKVVRTNATLHTYGGIDLWAWSNVPNQSLIDFHVPSFVYGRAKYDNWLTHQFITQNRRPVVDISQAVTLLHVKHDYHLVSRKVSRSNPSQQFWSADPHHNFEHLINSHLASTHGQFFNQMGTILHAPFKLVPCYEQHHPFCIFQRLRPHSCRCEYSSFVPSAQNDPYTVTDSRVVFCGLLSANHPQQFSQITQRYTITGRIEPNSQSSTSLQPFGIPLTQSQLLNLITTQTNTNALILVVADFSQASLLLQLTCSLRNNRLFSWLLIAALDDELYRFCVTRGLPVYLAEFDESSFKQDHRNFLQLARFQLTHDLLRLGKQVLTIEPGVVFSSSPWPYFNRLIQQQHIDICALPRVYPITSKHSTKQKEHISSAIVFVTPTKAAMRVVREVMMGLLKHKGIVAKLLRQVACSGGDEFGINGTACQGKGRDSPYLYFMQSDLFRAFEEQPCVACEDPIAWYPAVSEAARQTRYVIERLRELGLSRVQHDLAACDYFDR